MTFRRDAEAHFPDLVISDPIHLNNEYDRTQYLDTKNPGAQHVDLVIGDPQHLDNEYNRVRHLYSKTPGARFPNLVIGDPIYTPRQRVRPDTTPSHEIFRSALVIGDPMYLDKECDYLPCLDANIFSIQPNMNVPSDFAKRQCAKFFTSTHV